MLTPCKKVPCKSEWCKNNRKCWLYESYSPPQHKDPYKWIDGKYFPVNQVHEKEKYVPAYDTSNFYCTKNGRPRGVKYPKYQFDTKETECFYCGKEINRATRTKDHVFPRTKGGTLCEGNRVWSCQLCNSIKSNMTVLELRDKLKLMMTRKRYKNKCEVLQKILVKIEFMITKLYPN